MNNEEILKSAIEKADKNGCSGLPFGIEYADYGEYFDLDEWAKIFIFSHEFAKAFWDDNYLNKGEWHDTVPEGTGFIGHVYDYHLQQMVISEDPIQYLKSFL